MENFSSFLAVLHSTTSSCTEFLLHGNRRADDRHQEHEDNGVARDEDGHADLITDLGDGVLKAVLARVGLARHETVKAAVLSTGMKLVIDIAREDFLLILALDGNVNRDAVLDALDGAVEDFPKVPVIDGKGCVTQGRGRLDAGADAETKNPSKRIVQAMARDHFEERNAQLDETPALRIVLLEVPEAHDGTDGKDDPEPPEGLHGLADEQDDLRGKRQINAGIEEHVTEFRNDEGGCAVDDDEEKDNRDFRNEGRLADLGLDLNILFQEIGDLFENLRELAGFLGDAHETDDVRREELREFLEGFERGLGLAVLDVADNLIADGANLAVFWERLRMQADCVEELDTTVDVAADEFEELEAVLCGEFSFLFGLKWKVHDGLLSSITYRSSG